MFKLTITIENTDVRLGYEGSTIEKTLEFDTKGELENATANPEKLSDIAYDLFNIADKHNLLDPVEDDGDTYNGDTTNDLNA